MVVHKRRDFIDHYKVWKMLSGKVTLKYNDHYSPNNFEFLYLNFRWERLNWYFLNNDDPASSDQALLDAITFHKIPNFFQDCPFGFLIYWNELFLFMSLIFS